MPPAEVEPVELNERSVAVTVAQRPRRKRDQRQSVSVHTGETRNTHKHQLKTASKPSKQSPTSGENSAADGPGGAAATRKGSTSATRFVKIPPLPSRTDPLGTETLSAVLAARRKTIDAISHLPPLDGSAPNVHNVGNVLSRQDAMLVQWRQAVAVEKHTRVNRCRIE
eukprot:SAG31_NODE_10837_length_1092_cov_1.172205_1_plen_167_part_01